MMKFVLAALMTCAASSALAQAIVVNACTDLATMPPLTAGGTHYPYIDANGGLCVAEADVLLFDVVAEFDQ
jgi:hypothetical protein